MEVAGIPVLNYHSICRDENMTSSPNVSVSLNSFKEQIAWLHAQDYQSITEAELNDILHGKKGVAGKRVLITFDDGYYSLYEHALGILSSYNFKATLFLSTSFIGQEYQQSDFDFVKGDRQLTWPEIRELTANGWSIQSHGYTHSRMAYLDEAKIAEEVSISKDIIEQNLGTAVTSFAFPYGIYNKTVIDQLKIAGYKSAYTVHSGKLVPSSRPFQIPRIEINNRDTPETYKTKVSTGHISSYVGMRAKIRDMVFANPAVKDFVERWTHAIGYGNR